MAAASAVLFFFPGKGLVSDLSPFFFFFFLFCLLTVIAVWILLPVLQAA